MKRDKKAKFGIASIVFAKIEGKNQVMVSVIVPVYKVEPYLRQCLESIVSQTYRDLEIILVDDGSPDGCGSICDEFAKKDKRIKVFHKQNEGLSNARNYGIARATGDYLSFVDSDDWIESDMYEVLVSVANDNQADIVTSAVFLEYTGRTVIEQTISIKYVDVINSVKALIHGNFSDGVWDKIYRKKCFNSISFPFGHVFEDTTVMYKVLLNATNVVSIDKPLYHYRKDRKYSITNNHSMSNLIDYWLAHKSRYDFFLRDERFNTDMVLMDKLQKYCAVAIARTWRWCFYNSTQERKQYASFFKEMQEFASSHFPCFGIKGWPLFLRFSVFVARFNNVFVFALLYYMNQVYRWVRGLPMGVGLLQNNDKTGRRLPLTKISR